MTSEWIEHDGKGMPVPADTRVIVRFRGGMEEAENQAQTADWWGSAGSGSNWSHETPTDVDIVAYRILTPSKEKVETAS